MSMNAFVMDKIGQTSVVEKERPELGPLDAIVKPTKGLLCTWDCEVVRGALGRRKNLTLGHEIVGIVDEVGEEVRFFEPGDRVAVGAVTPEWNSLAAQNGHPSQTNGALGGLKFAHTKQGAFSEFVHVNDADGNLAHIPVDVTDHEAVYATDVMSTGFAAVENANVPMGGTVAVFGQGPIGLMATRGAVLQGAGKIIGIEASDARVELAKEYGADHVVNFREEDVVDRIMTLTADVGVDAAIEAVGSNETLTQAVEATTPGGTISNVGFHGHGSKFTHIPREGWGVGMAEKDIVSTLCPGGRLRLNRLLTMLENERVDPTRMTTHKFHFDEITDAFELLYEKSDGVIKPMIDFEADSESEGESV